MSGWHITTAELTLIGPVGVILGASVAYVAARQTSKDSVAVQRETTKATFEAQRQLAQDDRLWTRRAQLYEEIIELILSLWQFLDRPLRGDDLEEDDMNHMDSFVDRVASYDGKIHVLAGAAVAIMYKELYSSLIGMQAMIKRIARDGNQSFEDDALSKFQNFAHEAVRECYKRIRAELQGDEGAVEG